MKYKGKYLVSWTEEDDWMAYEVFKTKKEAKIFARSLIQEVITDEYTYTIPLKGKVLISKIQKGMKP